MAAESHIESQRRQGLSLKARAGIVLLGFLAIAGALLFTEHRAHVLGLLVWLPILACPLMHFFMHRGHGHHHGSDRDRGRGAEGRTS